MLEEEEQEVTWCHPVPTLDLQLLQFGAIDGSRNKSHQKSSLPPIPIPSKEENEPRTSANIKSKKTKLEIKKSRSSVIPMQTTPKPLKTRRHHSQLSCSHVASLLVEVLDKNQQKMNGSTWLNSPHLHPQPSCRSINGSPTIDMSSNQPNTHFTTSLNPSPTSLSHRHPVSNEDLDIEYLDIHGEQGEFEQLLSQYDEDFAPVDEISCNDNEEFNELVDSDDFQLTPELTHLLRRYDSH